MFNALGLERKPVLVTVDAKPGRRARERLS